MQASLPLYHIHCHKVRDLIQQSVFLDAMSKCSSRDFASYTTLVSKNMTSVERGTISRLIITFYSHVLPGWQGRLQFRDKNLETPDPLYDRQILLLEDLGHKSHQALIIFQLEISRSNTNNSVIPSLHKILGQMLLLETDSSALINDSKNTASYLPDTLMSKESNPQYLDQIIRNKKIESLRYFLFVQELAQIFEFEMQTTYLQCQAQTLDLRYVMAYYANTIGSAMVRPELRDRILVALTENLPQAFQIPFETLVERICNQACLTADEICQFTTAIANTYYRKGTNVFSIGLEKFKTNSFAYIQYILRSRLLVMLSSVVAQKRCREWIVNRRDISCWDILLSASSLENITKLKINVFSGEFKEDVFTTTELKLYEETPLAVAPLSIKYMAQFDDIFTNKELWKFNSKLHGETHLESLKWVHNLLQEKKQSEPMITTNEEKKVPERPPDITVVERIRQKQEALIKNPPSGKIPLDTMKALLKTYLLKATLDADNPLLLADPDTVIRSFFSEKTSSDTSH